MNDQDSVTTALKSLSLGTAAISYGILVIPFTADPNEPGKPLISTSLI